MRVCDFGFLLAVSLAVAGCNESAGDQQSAQATTSLGVANGFVDDEGMVAFLGLPFGKPPVNELRFKPPVAVDAWESPVDATEFGPACPQPLDPGQTLYQKQSEDCLTINVWTPSADDQQRPVMVWIHGGGWIYEGTEDFLYNGSRLAARGDAVVVSMEYRLGVFGFSHLDEVGGSDYEGSGNAGLLDQKLALEWVRDHIAAFGGDPSNVTIFGESAGGMSVTALMGMPAAQGLFHKAIAQSGAGGTARQTDYATAVSEALMDAAGVTDVQELAALSTEQLLAAQDVLIASAVLSDLFFGTVIDGNVFPKPPIQAIADGNAAGVPLLAGTNRDETRLWIVYAPVLTNMALNLAMTLIPSGGRAVPDGKTVEDAEALYERNRAGAEPGVITHAVGTDVFFRLPAVRHVEAQLAHQPDNTFLYRFDFEPAASAWDPSVYYGAFHAAELAFMFGTPEGWPNAYGTDGIPIGLVDQMMDAWIAFAETGDPNHDGMPSWPAYDAGDRPTMLFDATDTMATSTIVNDPASDERAFWGGVPFDGTKPTAAPEDL